MRNYHSIVCAVFLSFIQLTGCSDNKGSSNADLGKNPDKAQSNRDGLKVDLAPTDGSQSDLNKSDGPKAEGIKSEGLKKEGLKMEGLKTDVQHSDGAVSTLCQKVISNCSSSQWASMIINPFTVQNCISTFACVKNLYTGNCATLLNTFVNCAETKINAPADCDTKCFSEMYTLMQSCTCPASCGVSCP